MATCVLLYLQYFSAPEISTIPNTAEIELNVVAQSPEIPTEEPKITDEEIQRLLDVENEQKELILLFERVSADLKDARSSKKVLAQLMLGRSNLRDFGKRFYNYKLFRKSGGFLRYMRQWNTYINDEMIISLNVNNDVALPDDFTIDESSIHNQVYVIGFAPHPDLGNCFCFVLCHERKIF
jgi:hypothetical protein